ncbi:hypothetical protein [Leptobacterium sp. I13]|uniref:hypothetical protein n=1 Tax=Leptobacterium meishanense TaxID=3128904 RepID=UPI0030EE5B15
MFHYESLLLEVASINENAVIKYYLTISCFIGFFVMATAQDKDIPPDSKNKPFPSSSVLFSKDAPANNSLKDLKAPVEYKSLLPENKKGVNMAAQNNLVDPAVLYQKQFDKKKESKEGNAAYNTSQFLGEFKSNAKTARIICRDHEYVDGDIVRVYVNDHIVQPGIFLDYKFKSFELPLEEGFNKIDFQALNQGTSGPNTAEFQVYDDQGNLISANRWNLATGGKATLIIVKE